MSQNQKPLSYQYEEMVQRLFKKDGHVPPLLHAMIGISGEAGELIDIGKKHLVYGKPLDVEHIIEEMGDLEFYLEALRQICAISRENVLYRNMDKLSRRYPSGSYTDQHAQQRLDKPDGE